MSSLMNITAEIVETIRALDLAKDLNNEGLVHALEEELSNYLQKSSDKVDSCIWFIKQTESEIDLIDQEIDRLKKFKDNLKSRIVWIKQVSMHAMNARKETSLNGSLGRKFSMRDYASINVYNEALLPDKFKTEKVELVIDKNAIKDALKKGEFVEGAELVLTPSVQIR